jgi:hypothetical protein
MQGNVILVRIIDAGHHYALDSLDGEHDQTIRFVKRFRGNLNHSGTVNQDVLRVLIDRIQFLDTENPWALNQQILYHLRMALALHEARALIRKVEKNELRPESVPVSGKDGHYIIGGQTSCQGM